MNSLLLCIPFAGLLLCIAVMPLVKPEWWEKHQALAVIVWSLLFIIPSIVLNGAGETTETVLECIVNDYLTFIVLLFGLFCVSGNITLEGNLAGSPAVNALFLAFGTLLSSCIGTTGASMLLVRPMIKMNSWRKNKADHDIFYFHDLQYGWMSDTYRRSTTFNGIYAWCSILLELTLVPDFNFQYDFIIDHFLLN